MTRILVIEADTRARHVLKSILHGAGYEVECASDPAAGGMIHSAHPADLVIVDVVDDQSRIDFPGASLLVVPGGSSGREQSIAQRVRVLGAQAVLPKPFKRETLLAAVRSTLEMGAGTHSCS